MRRLTNLETLSRPCTRCGRYELSPKGKCRACNRERVLRYYWANRERVKGRNADWARRNRQKVLDTQLCWRKANREVALANNLRYSHGLTVTQYDQLVEHQDGVCAICKKKCTVQKRLSVDHDHGTGVVRGLLCIKCNSKVGVLENKEWRDAAEAYLAEAGVVKEMLMPQKPTQGEK